MLRTPLFAVIPLILAVFASTRADLAAYHTGAVNSVSFSPSGTYLVTGSDDRTVKLWRTRDGRPVLSLLHGTAVEAVAISDDGVIASGGWSPGEGELPARVNLWTMDGRPAGGFDLMVTAITSLAFSPEGTRLLIGTYEGAFIQNLATPDTLKWLDAGIVHGVGWTGDGKSVVTASGESRVDEVGFISTLGIVSVWAADGDTALATVELGGFANDLAVDARGRFAACTTDSGHIRLFSLPGLDSVSAMRADFRATAVAVTDSLVISAHENGLIRTWNHADELLRITSCGRNRILSLSTSCDGSVLAASGGIESEYVGDVPVYASTMTRTWTLDTGRLIRAMGRPTDSVSGLAVAPDGHSLLVGWRSKLSWLTGDRTARLQSLDTATGRVRWSVPAQARSVNDLASADFGVTCGDDGTVKTWSDDGSPVHVMVGHRAGVLSIAAQGNLIVSASADSTLRLWRGSDGGLLGVIGESVVPRTVSIDPDGRYLASSGDSVVKIWRISDLTLVRTLHSDIIGKRVLLTRRHAVLIGHRVASDYTLEGAFTVWSLTDGRTIHQGSPGGETVTCAAVHDETLYAGDSGGRITVWALDTGRRIAVMNAHAESVNALAVSADGQWIYSSGDDGTIKRWESLR
jgi:WD40 repeat protein